MHIYNILYYYVQKYKKKIHTQKIANSWALKNAVSMFPYCICYNNPIRIGAANMNFTA